MIARQYQLVLYQRKNKSRAGKTFLVCVFVLCAVGRYCQIDRSLQYDGDGRNSGVMEQLLNVNC